MNEMLRLNPLLDNAMNVAARMERVKWLDSIGAMSPDHICLTYSPAGCKVMREFRKTVRSKAPAAITHFGELAEYFIMWVIVKHLPPPIPASQFKLVQSELERMQKLLCPPDFSFEEANSFRNLLLHYISVDHDPLDARNGKSELHIRYGPAKN